MTGWHISIYRQADGGGSPAAKDSPRGARLAVWQSEDGGLSWLDKLVSGGAAIHLGGDMGYPYWYTAKAADLLPRVTDGPPKARRVWHAGGADLLGRTWAGRTTLDQQEIAQCRPDEWLLVEAWDES
jgi:hypothetical protein